MGKEEALDSEYRGRGTRLGRVANTVSAPQVGEDGVAGTIEIKRILTDLNRLRRYKYLERSGKDTSDEASTLRDRLHEYTDYGAAIEDLQARLEVVTKQVDSYRRERWKKWSKEAWSTRKNIYTDGCLVEPGLTQTLK